MTEQARDEHRQCRAQIAALEADVETAAEDRDAARAECAKQGARIAALEQHVSELEKSLENAQKERDALAEQVRAADARAFQRETEVQEEKKREAAEHRDLVQRMYRAERGRDESETRHRAEMREMLAQVAESTRLAEERLAERNITQAELDAALARLQPSGQVAEDVALVTAAMDRCAEPACVAITGPCPHASALSRIATRAQGYEAARADNAALLDALKLARTWAPEGEAAQHEIATALERAHPGAALLEEVGRLRESKELLQRVAKVARGLTAIDDETSTVIGPLLEERRKALEAAHQALTSQQAESHTLRRAFLHERHRADAVGAPPEHAYHARWAENLLADERKALVRARNEGLEKAEQRCDARCGQLLGYAKENASDVELSTRYRYMAGEAKIMANEIRAMKEPDGGQS